jgi:hypothetical protein
MKRIGFKSWCCPYLVSDKSLVQINAFFNYKCPWNFNFLTVIILETYDADADGDCGDDEEDGEDDDGGGGGIVEMVMRITMVIVMT